MRTLRRTSPRYIGESAYRRKRCESFVRTDLSRPATRISGSNSTPSTSPNLGEDARPARTGESGEKDLIDQPCGEEAAEDVRAAFREDHPVAALSQHRDGCGEVDRVAGAHRDHLRGGGCARAQIGRSALGREHQRSRFQHRVRRVERSAGSQDGNERLLGAAAHRAELGEGVRGFRIGAIDAPRSLRRRAERARADENGIRARAKEGEHELVRLALVRDDGMGPGKIRHSGDAVEGLDEVRDEARLVEAERTVEPRDLRRDVPARQVAVLSEDRKRRDHCVSVRNSPRRVSSSS